MKALHIHADPASPGASPDAQLARSIHALCHGLRQHGLDAHVEAAPGPLRSQHGANARQARWAAHGRAVAAARSGAADVVHLHVGPPRDATFAGLARVRSRKGSPVVVHAWHPLDGPRDPASPEPRVGMATAWAAKAGLWGVHRLFVASRLQARQLRRIGHQGPIQVVAAPVDTEAHRPASPAAREAARESFGLSGDCVLLCRGAPANAMRTADAVQHALDAAPDLQLLVAEPPGAPSALRRRLSQRRYAGRVQFTVDRDPVSLHAASDAALLPGDPLRGVGGHGHAALEAMAAGLPVVAFRAGAMLELLGHGAGCMVPPRDVPALAEALRTLADDQALRRSMGSRAREAVVASHDARIVARRLRLLYGTIAAVGAPRATSAAAPATAGVGSQR